MSDESAIRALVHAYAVAVDHRDPAAFVTLWADGGVLDVHREGPDRPRTNSSRMPAEVAQLLEALRSYDRSLHMVSTQHVVIDGETAIGEVGVALGLPGTRPASSRRRGSTRRQVCVPTELRVRRTSGELCANSVR
jgi:SnoaL-like domain